MQIKSISKEHYEGHVYNLGVDKDKSYFAEGVCVHNCRCIVIPVTKFEPWTPKDPKYMYDIETGAKVPPVPDGVEWGGDKNINPRNYQLRKP